MEEIQISNRRYLACIFVNIPAGAQQIAATAGADPGLYDDEGYLPLFSALSQDHAGISIRMLQGHVNPGNLVVIRTSQSTALHVACRFASPKVVEFLLERSTDPNVSDSHGNTPLHEAVYQNCSELEDRIIQTLQLLSDYGALADIESERYETVRDIGKTWFLPRQQSIPQSRNSSKVEGSDAEFNKSQGVWFDNPVIEQLFTAKPSFSSLCDNAARQTPLTGNSLAEEFDSKQKVPGAIENVEGAFLSSSSARFWGSLSPQTYKDSQTAPESTGETKSPGRKKQNKKKKWIALDILS
ncbi:hypothetical protein FNAPI_10325 [Fusarium napiforme]|uniref:Ankyrin repeat protein n=1 Tax=Fusarium napiforme TaxID=42672 RepID=A0A8H5IQV8_9HYPO|nr:hypothetical protein FNAPI_10325 [Fusarium napiforme]